METKEKILKALRSELSHCVSQLEKFKGIENKRFFLEGAKGQLEWAIHVVENEGDESKIWFSGAPHTKEQLEALRSRHREVFNTERPE